MPAATTRSSPGLPAEPLAVSSHKIVDTPVAELLSVFLEPHLNHLWNTGLSELHLLQSHGQTVALQIYPMPWPLNDREFVLSCKERIVESERAFYSTCASVEHAAFPLGEGRVRAQLIHSAWRFEALPDGRTRVDFQSHVDPKGALPKWIVAAAQQIGSHKLTNALVATQKRLDLPPRPEFVHWNSAAPARLATSPLYAQLFTVPKRAAKSARVVRDATTAGAAAVLKLPLTVVKAPATAIARTRSALRQYELLSFSPRFSQPLFESPQPLAVPAPTTEALGLLTLLLPLLLLFCGGAIAAHMARRSKASL